MKNNERVWRILLTRVSIYQEKNKSLAFTKYYNASKVVYKEWTLYKSILWDWVWPKNQIGNKAYPRIVVRPPKLNSRRSGLDVTEVCVEIPLWPWYGQVSAYKGWVIVTLQANRVRLN